MITVYKYDLQHIPGVLQEVMMPDQAHVVKVDMQAGYLKIWAWVNTERANKLTHFKIYPTGAEVKEYEIYVGTYFTGEENSYVWHLFQVYPSGLLEKVLTS